MSEMFEGLEARFFREGSSASRGAAIIDRAMAEGRSLGRLLRSHYVESVEGSDVERRAKIDDLLQFYAILEVAILSGYVGELPKDFKRRAIARLEQPDVRRYYEWLYPTLLVTAFARRLRGRPILRDSSVSDAAYHFLRVIDLGGVLEQPDVDSFLWLLDDGEFEREDDDGIPDRYADDVYDLGTLLNVMLDRKLLAKRLAIVPRDRTELDQALHGFQKFLSFCTDLDLVLQGLPSSSHLQSALWHIYGYWLSQIGGQVLGVIALAIEGYRDWLPGSQLPEKVIGGIHRSMDQSHRTLQRLTSAVYRAAIEEEYFKALIADTLN